ncbi:OprO/OprP family phosphate-selective porin [Novosphingobium clariflavum]|uniref:OprO/OprP family phosphate-selective porin n=1 Tax=Novosphingobium clariflavum TaxID=2029884 RepID=A0ABV6SCU1_9SPHN|nr:porin [Novosphingobium clariflavum]
MSRPSLSPALAALFAPPLVMLSALSPAAAHAQAISAEDAATLRAQVAALKAQVEQMEARLAAAGIAPTAQAAASALPPPAVVAAAPAANSAAPAEPRAGAAIAWKGSPQITEGERAFKVKGRIQADANYVGAPASLGDKGLGYSNEMRRIRLGAEGTIGGGFGYKLELELSDNAVDLVDTYVSYRSGPWTVKLGNQNPFQSLDELTGDTSGSVMERAAFTDAFNFERRLGASVQYQRGALLAQAGLFSDDIGALANDADGETGGDENDSHGADARLVYAPRLGKTQLHLGGSVHWRDLARLSESDTRYRQRPFVHSTNTRLIGSPAMQVGSEFNWGVEMAAIRGRWHAAAEYNTLTANRVDARSVRFQGAYGELGLFLTPGDSRGYKEGIFTNKAPARPLGSGGFGSLQLTARYDWLDLDDRDIRGGSQRAYIAALVWTPVEYLRFNLNYARLAYKGAKALPSGRTDYGANVIGTRFELDF